MDDEREYNIDICLEMSYEGTEREDIERAFDSGAWQEKLKYKRILSDVKDSLMMIFNGNTNANEIESKINHIIEYIDESGE